ncbi:hypothetical protein, partial [Pontibacter silvestris]
MHLFFHHSMDRADIFNNTIEHFDSNSMMTESTTSKYLDGFPLVNFNKYSIETLNLLESSVNQYTKEQEAERVPLEKHNDKEPELRVYVNPSSASSEMGTERAGSLWLET